MKIIEVLTAIIITTYILSSFYPLFKSINRINTHILRARKVSKNIGKNFEKIKYDVEDAASIKIFQRSTIAWQLTSSFLSTHTEEGNMLLLYFPEKKNEKYHLYFCRKDSLELYTGDMSGSVIVLNRDSERILDNIKAFKFIKKGKLIYLETEYMKDLKNFKKIERMRDFSGGYALITVTIAMMTLFSSLYLGFFILKNRIRENDKVTFQKLEEKNLTKEIKEYERKRIEKFGISYLTGDEKIWMTKDGISPGRYSIERIMKDRDNIYVRGDAEIPFQKMHLNNIFLSKYNLYLFKDLEIENKRFKISTIVYLEYLPKNLNHSFPDVEKCLQIRVEVR